LFKPGYHELLAFSSSLSRRVSPWSVALIAVAFVVALPVLVVLAHIVLPTDGVWQHLASTVLGRYLNNTFWLVVTVGLGTLIIGTGTAWLVVMCRFPGKRLFEWGLLLPLAVPTYVIAYAYTDFLQFAGPLQSLLRETFGWGYGDYYFPNIRSLGGAATVITLVLYPYVYLLARASFLEQSVCVLDVGRTLGRGPLETVYQRGGAVGATSAGWGGVAGIDGDAERVWRRPVFWHRHLYYRHLPHLVWHG